MTVWVPYPAGWACLRALAGYWLIRVTLATVDAAWAKIKAATEAGKLGYKSKVATIGYSSADERVIHVMTYDANDAADVARVGDALRELGYSDLRYECGA